MEGQALLQCVILFFCAMQTCLAEECTFKPPCTCETEGYPIDLSQLMEERNHVPLVVAGPKGYFYHVNLCNNPLKSIPACYNHDPSLVACQVQGNSVYGIGKTGNNLMAGDPQIGTVTLSNSYVDKDSTNRSLSINLKCSTTEGSFKYVTATTQAPFIFTFSLETSHACKIGVISEGISAGSVMVILFFVLVAVYLIGGILFLKYVRKAEGAEVIPNNEFWKDFPMLVKDGVRFTFRGCKAETTYEKI